MEERNPLKHKVITIDGPSASGKGTLATRLSFKYKIKYLDTGTLYRALVYQVLQAGIDPNNTAEVVKIARELSQNFDFKHVGNNNFATFAYGENIEHGIRTPEVDKTIPLITPKPEVRQALRDFQVTFVNDWKDLYGVLLDGRDTGGIIWPNADVKFFIVADTEIRAKRRVSQMSGKGISANFAEVYADLLKRDERDAPNTIKTDDAVVLDVVKLNADETEAAAVEVIEEKLL